ncbi:SAM-dependent methyltransferase [Sphingomonas naphthae]|uniref:SAM-dependent methyltransferase n=1 Tax=Sphingomonas naphthae TaxID=1813468 RepID=A0ABY7TMY4_9SPHN|nr:SAM-dependent methyltransferase [Sphingomonas naphthae]WCT74585.1 SAM-dependent methyltransferase [Sphingomonas naphthae]
MTENLPTTLAARAPLSVHDWMAACNAHYYATRDPLGATGDFVTAPEVSQMFGEMIGLWLADLWQRAGRPPAHYVELGPGRGTLAVDALRAMAKAGLTPAIHLVETSPVLREAQRARLPGATWHDTIDTLPADGALMVVANEFFDALPVRQTIEGRERMVHHVAGRFVADAGNIREDNPATQAIATALATRIAGQGGALLAIDYGYAKGEAGDTLQAVRGHAPVDPFADPGEHDLTTHVDFAALAAALRAGGAATHGPIPQGQWLVTLGLAQRAAALARSAPERGEEIAGQYRRLTAAEEMGQLFKVLAATAQEWVKPAGF